MNILSQLMKNVSGFGTPRYPEAKRRHLDVRNPSVQFICTTPSVVGIYRSMSRFLSRIFAVPADVLEQKLYACGEPGWTYNRHPHRMKDHIRGIAKLPYNLAFFNVQTLKMLTNGDGIPTNRFSDPIPGRLNASRV